jgi:hypothetical protein
MVYGSAFDLITIERIVKGSGVMLQGFDLRVGGLGLILRGLGISGPTQFVVGV